MGRIIVKPVAGRTSAQNRHLSTNIRYDHSAKKWSNTGVPSNKTKVTGAVEVYSFVKSGSVFKTGLDEYTENIYLWDKATNLDEHILNVKSKYSLNAKWDLLLQRIVKEDKVSFQTLYEIFFGLEPNDLKYQSIDRLQHVIGKDNPASVIEAFRYTLYDGANVIETGLFDSKGKPNTLRNLLAYHLVKNHPRIALDKTEVSIAVHNWFIAEEYQEEQELSKLDELENEAIFRYTSFKRNNSTTSNMTYKLAVLLTDSTGTSIVKGESNIAAVDTAINRYLKTRGKNQKDYLSKLDTALDTYERSKERFDVEYVCRQAYNVGILYNKDGKLYWKGKHDDPTWFAFSRYENFVNSIFEEFGKTSSKNKDTKYTELIAELKEKGF